ncbi:MAG: PAS domain-containing protein [Ignavibacteriaceae bacterium]
MKNTRMKDSSGNNDKNELLKEIAGLSDEIKKLKEDRNKQINEHVQQAVLHERQLLRTLIDNIPDAFYVKDIECRKTVANYIDIHNLGAKSEAELIGKTDFDFFTKEVAENFYRDDLSVLQGNPVINREEYFIDPEGKKRWLLTSKIPIHDRENNITGLVGIGRDITERKNAEEAYHEASEKFKMERNLFKTLIDSQPDFIFFKNTEGRFILNNLAHLKYLGAEKQEDTLNKTIFDFAPQEVAEKQHDVDLKVIRSGEAVLDKEETILLAGETRWHLVSKIPLKDGEGKVSGLLGVSHDITSRKKAEEALSESTQKLAEYSATLEEKVELRTKMLQQKNEELDLAFRELKDAQAQLIQAEKMASLGQLTAGIAHEIKNPLNFVNNFARLSKDLTRELKEEINEQQDKLDTNVVECIKEILDDLEQNVIKIDEHGKRADSIIKGMLLHSRGKAGEMIETDINNLLKEYVGLSYHGFRANDSSFNVNIETSYDQSIGMIRVIPQDISRVFLNIINNACYSTNEKKTQLGEIFKPAISVSTKDLNNKIQIQIRDNGFGIPKDIMEKVFNPFFTTKPTGKGTGLGLSLSYDIVVQLHKGELKVESEAGEFAEFTIVLPKNL